MTDEKNTFAEIDSNEFLEEEQAPVESTSELIGQGAMGVAYDYNTAPDFVKAPPRVDLNGKTLTILKAEIILPGLDTPWGKTRDKSKDVKNCIFKLFFDFEGQQEYLSGVRVFKTQDGKYSHPSFTKDGKTQASDLLVKYAKFKNKSPAEVTLKEFLSYLNSKPKVKIVSKEFENPVTAAMVRKNIVEAFV